MAAVGSLGGEWSTLLASVDSLCGTMHVPDERMADVRRAVQDVNTVVKKCFPEAEVQCYGSMVTGMMSKLSDVSAHLDAVM